MDDLVERKAFLAAFEVAPDEWCKGQTVRRILADLPAVAAVPVVRCCECGFRDELYSGDVLMCSRKMSGIVKPTDFCSYGKRKDGE